MGDFDRIFKENIETLFTPLYLVIELIGYLFYLLRR